MRDSTPPFALELDRVHLDLAEVVRATFSAFASLHLAVELTTPSSLPAVLDLEKTEVALLALASGVFEGSSRSKITCSLYLDEVGIALEVTHPRRSLFDALAAKGGALDPNVAVDLEALAPEQRIFGCARVLLECQGGSLLSSSSGPATGQLVARLPPPRLAAVDAPAPARAPAVALDPLALAGRAATFAVTGRVPLSAAPLVLVVEDSRAIQRLISESLGREYAIVSIHDGVAALAAASVLAPDAIVLDVALPGLDGETLVGLLRSARGLAYVPFVVLTGDPDPRRVVRMLESGAQDYLAKPFLMPELAARVRNLLAAKRSRDVLNQTIGEHETDLLTLARQVADRQRALEALLEQLEHARREAELASRIKSSFLRMMSHELKTPVAAMELTARVLENDKTIRGSAGARAGIDRISRSTRRLVHLVDTVLEWARAESGQADPSATPIDIEALVCATVSELAPAAAHKHLGLRWEGLSTTAPVVIVHDPRIVHLLVVNLLERAIQVTDVGTIAVSAGPRPRGCWIAVQDRGPRVESVVEVFDPLRDPADLHRASGHGSGLGLHVARDIARAVGADVVLARASEAGNTFVLELSASAEAPASAAEKLTGSG